MQNLETATATAQSTKKIWSDPQITILSVKNDTLGGGSTSSDTGTQS